MFKWAPFSIGLGGNDSYFCCGMEIARLTQRVDTGQWQAILDMHLGDARRYRLCTSLESGRRGAELWAERHRERLVAECEGRVPRLPSC